MQDVGVQLRGPVAVDVANSFSQRWRVNFEPFLPLFRAREEGF
jgi:phosphatidylserine/phosphatidylglycerophosphate/cardiolipin synthase-like enzyme